MQEVITIDNKIFGYCRVSSKEQNPDRQVNAILEFCKKENMEMDRRDIFIDKISGKSFNRPEYDTLKRLLRSGDILIIKELDRFGRNKQEIKDELDYFKQRKIRVMILNIPTTLIKFNQEQDWILDMINNILIEVLGAVAEEEREKIRKRQREGIDNALAKGVKLGRPKTKLPPAWEMYYIQWRDGNLKTKDFMELVGLKTNTFYRLVKEYEKSNTIFKRGK